SVDAEADRSRVVSGLWGLLRMASDAAPVVVVLEDLHWATDVTMFALRHVLRNVAGKRVLLVGTYRDDEPIRPDLAAVVDEPGVVAGDAAVLRRCYGRPVRPRCTRSYTGDRRVGPGRSRSGHRRSSDRRGRRNDG